MTLSNLTSKSVPFQNGNNEQKGVATIFMTVVLLLSVGLIALYTNRAAIMEQRLSANEIRTKQAFAAANAGLDHALAYMRSGGIDQNNDNVIDPIISNTLTSTSGQSSFYRAVYCDASTVPNCPASHTNSLACTAVTAIDLAKINLVSCGWSDDDSSVQRVVQGAGFTSSLGGTVSTPVVTRGTANLLTGGASILNYFNDLTVWSGASFLGQSNTGKTFIRDQVTNPSASLADDYRNIGNSPACNNPPTGYQCSTQGSTLGHDTVPGDVKLSSMSSDGFFQFFFGETPNVYRDSTATWVVDLGSSLSQPDSTSLNSIVGMQDKSIWVEGNASLPGNIGTQDHPVVLIINGDLNLSANSVINGLVYVSGTITGNGSPTIYGALIGAGSANTTGNLKVVFDPKVLGKSANLGQPALLQGSWRDW